MVDTVRDRRLEGLDILDDIRGWPYLAEVMTPELYRNNAFRITGLDVTSTAKQAKTLQRKREQAVRLGLDFGIKKSPFPLPIDVSGNAFKHAINHKLSNPHRRLVNELFWFWPVDFDRPVEEDEALSALQQGQILEAERAWKKLAVNGGHPSAIHNLAVFWHLRILDYESRSPLSDKEREKLSAAWRVAMRNWANTVLHDGVWQILLKRANSLDESIGRNRIMDVRHHLPVAILKINVQLGIGYGLAGSIEDALRQRDVIWGSDFPKRAKTTALRTGAESKVATVHRHAETAGKAPSAEPSSGRTSAIELLQNTSPIIQCLNILDPEQVVTSWNAARDSVAETALSSLISYVDETKDWESVQPTLHQLAEIAHSEMLKQRIKENHDAGEIEKIFLKCREITEAEAAATQKYHSVIRYVFPMLNDLKQQMGAQSEAYKTAANITAMYLRAICVDIHNLEGNLARASQGLRACTKRIT